MVRSEREREVCSERERERGDSEVCATRKSDFVRRSGDGSIDDEKEVPGWNLK